MLEKMPPFLSGGDMIGAVHESGATWADGPRKFEAGTRNVGGEVGFAAAIDYMKGIGWEAMETHEHALLDRMLAGMRAMPWLTVYGEPVAEGRYGVVSFNVNDVHPHDVATILDAGGVAVRAGHHCAQPLMEFLGIYGISDSMQTTIETVSDNIFGIVWNSGIQILIFLAALQNIPVSAKEAAQMEGATAWEYFWKITLPYVSPMILACFIFTIIDSFTDPNNVVMGRILDLQSDWQYGPASAMAWVYFAIVLAAVGIITAILNKFIFNEVD